METSQQQRGSTLGQFTQILKDAKLDFDAIDLIDILWLAQCMELSVYTSSLPESEDKSSVEVEDSNEVKSVYSPPQDALNIYAQEPPSPSLSSEPKATPSTQPEQPRGMPFAVPAAPALRTKFNLARALRPLMLKVPSPNQLELDEDASVSQIAATKVWMPVFRAKTERWLELDFVVESSKTTVIWEQAIAELKQLAEYQGAFRAVRTWRLSGQGERVQIFPRWSKELSQLQTDSQPSDRQSPHTPKELIDPSGRRLIWLVTDCTSSLWQTELIYQTLADWADGQPVAIVQLFPQHLWSRTALRNGHIVRLSALKPGSPSNYLTKEGLPQILERRRSTGLITIPIVTLDPESMRTWARVVSGCGDSRTPGRTFDLVFISRQAQRTKAEPPPTSQPTRTAQERVDFFRATASQTTQRLANLMAATPVSLPVIDLLREAFRSDFSEEVQQYHVVEVLLSGLLRRCDQEDDQICRYEFFGDRSPNREERVRDILLGDTLISQTMRVLNVLSDAICRKLGGPSKSFLALLEDLKSLNTQEEQTVLPFARIGLDVLRCLGGEYTKLANEYQRILDSPSLPASVDLPPLQPCTYKAAFISAILERFEFETATIKQQSRFLGLGRGEWIITRSQGANWGYIEPLSQDIGLEMVAIPEGSFLMGSPRSEPESRIRERPQHQVHLQPFYLGRYPITQEQWRIVAGYERVTRELKPDPSRFKGDKLPVENVSWEDAEEFCQRLSAKTGKDYRLPSEAQWEYACRAETTTPFNFGNIITTDLANYDGNYSYNDSPKGKYREQTTEVGSFPANAWGLCDMHGNVREWCADDWHEDYTDAPSDGSAWLKTAKNDQNKPNKLLRGGSWLFDPGFCRSASRYDISRDFFSYDVGFRVGCVVPSALLSS
jgi:formylglycine-generating enzyme required for sulfatase activity